MKKQIPNIVTLLNLLCGCIAAILAVNSHFIAATFFVFAGIFFDFFDGFLARKLNVQSDFGIQLDSLADMVTSGLVPGIVMFKLISLATNSSVSDEVTDWGSSLIWADLNLQPIALIGLLITLASAYRLAKFNIDEDQQSYFKGLPTPANAILILSLPMIIEFQNNDSINAIILNKWFLIAVTLLSCYLLNAPIKLFALKFKTWDFGSNTMRYIFILLSLVLIIVLHFAAIPIIILSYIILSLISKNTIV